MKKRIMCLILLSLTIIMYGCGGTDSVANQSADSATAPAEEIKAVEEGLTISKDVAEEGDRIWYVTGRDETEVETGKDDVFGKNSVVDAVFIFNNNNVTLFDYDSVDEPLSIIEVSQMTDDEILDILEQRYAKTLGKGQFYVEEQGDGSLNEYFNYMPNEKGHAECAAYDLAMYDLQKSLQVKDVFFSGYDLGGSAYLVTRTDEKKEFHFDNLGNDGIKERNGENREDLFAEEESKFVRDTTKDKRITIKDSINSSQKELFIGTYHDCAHKTSDVDYVHIAQNGKIKSFNLRASFDKKYYMRDFLNKSIDEVEKMLENDGYTDKEWDEEWEAVLDTDASGNSTEKETVSLDGEYYEAKEFYNFKIGDQYVASFGGLMKICEQPELFEFDKADGDKITEE